MNDWLKMLWNDERKVTPSRAVMHPAWILAVFVLLVNDHVIKPAAMIEPLAGKISDFAGLFLFPVLLATLLRVKTRRGLWASGAATAVVFSAINLSPTIAAAFDALLAFSTTVDPTDLIALLAIPAGLVLFEPLTLASNGRRTTRAVEAAAVTLGGLASMATSEPPCEECFVNNQSSQVSILNKTNELHVLRIRNLRGGIQFDCDRIMADPVHYLVDGAFDAPESWFVQSGQEIPVRREQATGSACQVALVETDTAPDIFVVWSSELPMKTFAFDADVPREIPADERTVVLDADYSRAVEGEMHAWRERSDCGERADLCGDETLAPLATIPTGARYFWRSQSPEPLHFPKPSVVQGTLPNDPVECETTTASDGLVWENAPRGEYYVLDVSEGRDGCHELHLTTDLENTENPVGWWLCAPFDAIQSLVPTTDAQKRIVVAVQNQSTFDASGNGGYHSVEIAVTTLGADLSGVGLETLYFVKGYGLPEEIDFQPELVPIEGCTPRQVECGQIALPVDVELGAYGERLRPGESITVGEVAPLEIHMVRAEARPVIDTTCDATDLAPPFSNAGLNYMEAVIVRQVGGR